MVIGDDEAALAHSIHPHDLEASPGRSSACARPEEYRVEHHRLRLDPEARNLRHTHVEPADDRSWRVQQMLVDPEGLNDWVAEFEVDLAQSRTANAPVLRLTRIGNLV